jgi:LmbE family N-acetylglucosaminyl deacetylase
VAARAVVRASCDAALDSPRPATRPSGPEDAAAYDVVVYTAHPDDEAMYAGGTLVALQRARRKVAVVVLSHGEGGRLLERADDGRLIARRDYPRAHVIGVRDAELAAAATAANVEMIHLDRASATNAIDFGFTKSCEETLARWNEQLPGGLERLLRVLVADIRSRRPTVVLTLDPHDDPQASGHGHHRATGVLVELAARLAAAPSVKGRPHAVRELLTFAPLGARSDVEIATDVEARLRILRAYPSQFDLDELPRDEIATRPTERYLLRWRRTPLPASAPSWLVSLLLAPPRRSF